MLNFIEISQKIETPSMIQLEDLEGLRLLSERFPFTAVFSQLYLKGLALHNTIQFEVELKNHAYKIPDRSQLFYLVHSVEENKTEVIFEQDVSEVKSLEPEQKESKVELVNEETTEPSLTTKDSIKDVVPNVEAGANYEDEELDATEEEKAVNTSNKLRSISDLERDIIAHAISSSIFIEVGETEEDTYHFGKLKKTDQLPEDTEKYDSETVEFDLPLKDRQENKISTSEINQERKSFTSWMSSFIDDDRLENKLEKSVDSHLENENLIKNTKEKEEIKEISAQEKRKSEFFSPIKKARESLDESRLPVSETLAKVYAAQGNYPKAIEAYGKLLLKFPEKKSFFALQIETLKRKLN